MDEWKEAILNIVYDDWFERCKQLQKEYNFTYDDFPGGILAVYNDSFHHKDVDRMKWLTKTYLSSPKPQDDAPKTTSSSS